MEKTLFNEVDKTNEEVKRPTINPKLEDKLSQLSKSEQTSLLRQLSGSDTSIVPKYKHHFSRKRAKIGVISDSHIGSKYFNEELTDKAFQYFKRNKVEAIYHAGDILEGMSGRPGHIYELDDIGLTAQLDKATKILSSTDIPIYGITGNHDHWYMQKADIGADVGKMLEERVSNFTHLGLNEADIELRPDVTMKIIHPAKGSSYALSYQGQKLIESFEEHEKPDISVSGHYHKALYMNLRDVHHIEAGTLQAQSGWMRSKNLQAHEGFWLLDAYYNKDGLNRLKTEFIK